MEEVYTRKIDISDYVKIGDGPYMSDETTPRGSGGMTFPVIRNAFPELIAHELVGVQPMVVPIMSEVDTEKIEVGDYVKIREPYRSDHHIYGWKRVIKITEFRSFILEGVPDHTWGGNGFECHKKGYYLPNELFEV